MVNASLNWASIVGIVLAVGGAFLYFMRSFKPALARDYDVFFAAIGLLCGGILFFQGWRLDPILQFGQFLLAGTTVFFAYESVRLRGVTTEQARRSSYFDDDEPLPAKPRMGGRAGWDDDADRFEEPQPLRRRIRSPSTKKRKTMPVSTGPVVRRPGLPFPSGPPAVAPQPTATGMQPSPAPAVNRSPTAVGALRRPVPQPRERPSAPAGASATAD